VDQVTTGLRDDDSGFEAEPPQVLQVGEGREV